jgi:hypothetical protein
MILLVQGSDIFNTIKHYNPKIIISAIQPIVYFSSLHNKNLPFSPQPKQLLSWYTLESDSWWWFADSSELWAELHKPEGTGNYEPWKVTSQDRKAVSRTLQEPEEMEATEYVEKCLQVCDLKPLFSSPFYHSPQFIPHVNHQNNSLNINDLSLFLPSHNSSEAREVEECTCSRHSIPQCQDVTWVTQKPEWDRGGLQKEMDRTLQLSASLFWRN